MYVCSESFWTPLPVSFLKQPQQVFCNNGKLQDLSTELLAFVVVGASDTEQCHVDQVLLSNWTIGFAMLLVWTPPTAFCYGMEISGLCKSSAAQWCNSMQVRCSTLCGSQDQAVFS